MADEEPILVKSIGVDEGRWPREGLRWEAVEDYAQAMQQGVALPRITVFGEDGSHYLADGWHPL